MTTPAVQTIPEISSIENWGWEQRDEGDEEAEEAGEKLQMPNASYSFAAQKASL